VDRVNPVVRFRSGVEINSVNALRVRHNLRVDFAAVVRSSLEAGDTPDQVAQALINVHHLLPISAIKALRSGGNMTSEEAKEVIKRNLPAEQWIAAEGLWEAIAASEAAVGDDA
jgi:hypothetical protein